MYLCQFFAVRTQRRYGIGRIALSCLLTDIWPRTTHRTVSVLVYNTISVAFWHAMGYQDEALTLEIIRGTRCSRPGSS